MPLMPKRVLHRKQSKGSRSGHATRCVKPALPTNTKGAGWR